jgi:DNA repair exonuclease SbcCD nuclease subunit
MKIFLTGDFHVKKGITTDIIINYLDYALQYCLSNDIQFMIILGDIFDKSSNIKNEAFVPLFMKFLEIERAGINLTFILGNHDIYNVNNDSIVETFSPLGHVVKEAEYLPNIGDFSYLPYTKKEEDIQNNPGILFTHIPIADFNFDNAFHATEKHAFSKALFDEYSIVFTGHFHRHQAQKNIVYVGSPIQLNFGEMGITKGFVVLDAIKESWEFVPYTGAPTYTKIDIQDFKNFDPTNKFVGVMIDEKIENFIKLRKILIDKGAIEVRPFFEKKEEMVIQEKSKINNESSTKEIIREYIGNVKEKNIDNSRLINIFDKISEDVV